MLLVLFSEVWLLLHWSFFCSRRRAMHYHVGTSITHPQLVHRTCFYPDGFQRQWSEQNDVLDRLLLLYWTSYFIWVVLLVCSSSYRRGALDWKHCSLLHLIRRNWWMGRRWLRNESLLRIRRMYSGGKTWYDKKQISQNCAPHVRATLLLLRHIYPLQERVTSKIERWLYTRSSANIGA